MGLRRYEPRLSSVVGRGLVVGRLAGAVPFTPAAAPGAIDYWRGGRGRWYQHADGTVPWAADGDPVLSWVGSKSGLTIVLSGNPVGRTAGGLYWLACDGTGDVGLATVSVTGATFSCWLTVAETASNDSGGLAVLYNAGSSEDFNTATGTLIGYDTGTLSDWRNSTQFVPVTRPATNTPFVYATRYTGSNHVARINGADNTPQASSGAFNADRFLVGGRRQVSTNGNPAAAVNVYGLAIGAADWTTSAAQLDTYMGALAGLTL